MGREALTEVLIDRVNDVPPPGPSYPGSWAVDDFRRLLQDFPDSREALIRGALKALGAPRVPAG